MNWEETFSQAAETPILTEDNYVWRRNLFSTEVTKGNAELRGVNLN